MRAFLYAGAENVIASSWQVPDRASGDLLPELYRALCARKLSPGDALRQAQMSYLERLEPGRAEQASPHYWGAWTVWGAGVGAERVPAAEGRR